MKMQEQNQGLETGTEVLGFYPIPCLEEEEERILCALDDKTDTKKALFIG